MIDVIVAGGGPTGVMLASELRLQGVHALVRWTRRLVEEVGADVRIDWHGHRDRDLAVKRTPAFLAVRASVEDLVLNTTSSGIVMRAASAQP